MSWWRPISDVYKFPVYNSARDFKNKTGREAPPFDPSKPVKTWADPFALDKRFPVNVSYDVVMIDPATNTPIFTSLSLRRQEASEYNIPGDEAGKNESIAFEKDTPIPIEQAKIRPGEVLGDDPLPGVVVVLIDPSKKDAVAATVDTFTVQDRQLLHKIAKAVGAL